jgi:ribosomal-protein-alanine N-acetyltransferase
VQTNITTSRLQLASLQLTDSAFILELTNTKEWIAFIGDRNLHTTEDAEKYIGKIMDNPDVHYWMVHHADSGTTIGAVTLIKRDYLAHRDIGFAFLPQYAKQGFAYEATKAVMDTLPGEQLHAITVKENINSIHLLEKLGLHFDKEVTDKDEVLLLYGLDTK